MKEKDFKICPKCKNPLSDKWFTENQYEFVRKLTQKTKKETQSEIERLKKLNEYWQNECKKLRNDPLREKIKYFEIENKRLYLLNMAFQEMWTVELPKLIKESYKRHFQT